MVSDDMAVLPNPGLIFRKAAASLSFGEPILVGRGLLGEQAALLDSLHCIESARQERIRQVILDEIAAKVFNGAPES